MRFLLAIFWLRRRLAIRGITGIAGAATVAAGLALALLAVVGALILAGGLGLALHLAWMSKSTEAIRLAWTVTLYTTTFFAICVPIITGAGTSDFDPSRLLMFPVGRGRLRALALLTEFLSAPHLVWYPALLVSAVVGVLIPGPHRPGQLAVLGLFALVLVVWAHATTLMARRWLRNRRVRELAAAIGLAFVVLVSMAPATMHLSADDADKRIQDLLRVPPWMVRATEVLPPSIASRALEALRSSESTAAGASLAWLTVWLAVGLFASRVALDSLLYSESYSGNTPSATIESAIGRLRTRLLDRLPPPVGAIASKEFRYLLQSGAGRVSLLSMPVISALPALLGGRYFETEIMGVDLQSAAYLGIMVYAAVLMGYLQVNAFAWERSGITSCFTSPVRLHDVLLGKNMGVWLLGLIFVFEGLLVWSAIRGIPHPATVISGFLVFATTTVLLSILGNFTSIAVPVSSPVTSLTSSASALGTLVMIGCLLGGVALGGATVIASGLLGAPNLQPVFDLVIFASTAVVYRWSLTPAARALGERRDDVFHALGVG